VLRLAVACAQQGNITGGPKDVLPPKVVSSLPENYATQFHGKQITITFNEYFSLKDINKQLVISPPMSEKPVLKIKGKSLLINFPDSLQSDRTYTINFGDALVDLNEGNPIKNFQFVFSTGNTIDSLQISGRVVDAADSKPCEDIVVMLYSGTADSLPLKTIPVYISRTDKEGNFSLKNLSGGSYKIFALKDANSNYLFDQPTEAIAFSDSLLTPVAIPDTVSATVAITAAKDSLLPVKDSAKIANQPADTLPVKPKFRYLPDQVELRLFTESRHNQYLSGSDRLRRDQIRLRFNEKIDTLGFDFLNLPADSIAVTLDWQDDPDTLDFWIVNKKMAEHDSLTALLTYKAYDSLERIYLKTDTARLKFRTPAAPAKGSKKDFTVTTSIEKSKSLDYNQPILFTCSLPYITMDTSRFQLKAGRDSASRNVPYKWASDTLKGLILNGVPIQQIHPRMIRMLAPFVADTAYRLTMLPGAFIGINGQKNDTLDVRFKMKSKEQYGSIKLTLPDLKEPAIIELVDSRSKVVARKLQDSPGTITFSLLAPGKYTARLIYDTNKNGRWDTGRYSKHLQPERVVSFSKEINLKANWEVSETWQ